MYRRQLLVALGTGVSLSGCLGSDSSPEMLALGESFEASGGTTVTLHDVRIRRIVFTRSVHVDPHYQPGHQFLVADASVSDRNQLGNFAVIADDDRIETGRNDSLVAFDEPAGELLGLAVPAPLDADHAAVRWTGPDGAVARWTLDADHLDALAHPPEFEVQNFEIPEEVERGSAFAATLTVENTGSGDGTFFAELGATTISDTPEIRVEVPAGETVTAERTVKPYYPESDDELPVVLNWGADRLKRTAKIAD